MQYTYTLTNHMNLLCKIGRAISTGVNFESMKYSHKKSCSELSREKKEEKKRSGNMFIRNEWFVAERNGKLNYNIY